MPLTNELRTRALRPALSLRYQYLLRQRSTIRPNAAQDLHKPNSNDILNTTPTPLPPRPSFFRRNRTSILCSALALLLGLASGTAVIMTVYPPPMPERGSYEDTIMMEDLNKRIDEEFRVSVLRGKCLGVAGALKGRETGWVELVGQEGEGRTTLSREMGGARGLGVERVFWDRGEKRLVAVVWFGGSLSGWPGVTHGGLLATVLQEKIALANGLATGAFRKHAKIAAVPQRLPGTGNHAKMPYPDIVPVEPAQSSIDYLKPTYANQFYTIRVVPAWEEENVRLPVQGAEWIATLETMDASANICVKSAAKFEARTEAERVEAGHGNGKDEAKSRYAEFREWMWPSRQQQSQMV